MPRANTTANAILGLLALRPSWTATELTDQIGRNMRYFWPRAASRVFGEARALGRGWLGNGNRRGTIRPRRSDTDPL